MTLLALLAAVTPTPGPTLPASIVDEDLVTPGWIGFTVMFLIALAVIYIAIDMVRRIRRVNYRAEIRERLEVEEREDSQ